MEIDMRSTGNDVMEVVGKSDEDFSRYRSELNPDINKMNEGKMDEKNEIVKNTILRGLGDDVFDMNRSVISAHLSALAYCDEKIILNGNYSSFQLSTVQDKDVFPSSLDDFTPKYIIHDDDHDVFVFVGYSKALNSIFVVFRGSTSTANWLNNFNTVKTDYPVCDGCEVHEGFYLSAQSVRNDVLESVKELQNQFPSFLIIVTGHSLGGALATLSAMHLTLNNVTNIRHFSFGSPRVVNSEGALYISNLVHTTRVTHYRDIVPHNPFESFGYRHVFREWYENNRGVVSRCSGGEDARCANQWIWLENIGDHHVYLGRSMTCTIEDSSSTLNPSSSPSLSPIDSASDKNKSTNIINTDTQSSLPFLPIDNLRNRSTLLPLKSFQSSNSNITESSSLNGNSSLYHFPRDVTIISVSFVIFALVGICCATAMNRILRKKKEYYILS